MSKFSECIFCDNYKYCHGSKLCNSFVPAIECAEQEASEREISEEKIEYREAWADYVDESLY